MYSVQFTVDSCGIFLLKMIETVAKGDTITVNYQLSTVNYFVLGRLNRKLKHKTQKGCLKMRKRPRSHRRGDY